MAEEKAEKQAQKKKETAIKTASQDLLVRIKAYIKARKALVIKKKVVRFVDSDAKEGVSAARAKRTISGHD
jgi:hypothetical protein